MKVKVVAHFDCDQGRVKPGQIIEVRDPDGENYLKLGWVIRFAPPPTVELAASPGAPETAVSRRGRVRRPT